MTQRPRRVDVTPTTWVECVSSTVARSGEPYRNEIVAVHTVLGGRIVTMREYLDTLPVARVLFGGVAAEQSAGTVGAPH